ncbi:hypothetical protein HDU96_002459 [Phlyctochytrium bullatum]|nr:hypothetical protein HDU96_002459 [Phlyctochytrium bullatum]
MSSTTAAHSAAHPTPAFSAPLLPAHTHIHREPKGKEPVEGESATDAIREHAEGHNVGYHHHHHPLAVGDQTHTKPKAFS